MRMNDKTAAGDRFVPVHSKITGLLDKLVKDAGKDVEHNFAVARRR